MSKLAEIPYDELTKMYKKADKVYKAKLNKTYGSYPSDAEYKARQILHDELRRRRGEIGGRADLEAGLKELTDAALKEKKDAGQEESKEGSGGVQGGEPQGQPRQEGDKPKAGSGDSNAGGGIPS